MIAGYSGTPLPRKLGIKTGHVVGTFDAPGGFVDTLGELPDTVRFLPDPGPDEELDVAVAFVTDEAVLRDAFSGWKGRIRKDGGLWIAWPKKSSPLATDLRESHVRATGLESGLVDNKICAIDADWSGLRFVYRREDR